LLPFKKNLQFGLLVWNKVAWFNSVILLFKQAQNEKCNYFKNFAHAQDRHSLNKKLFEILIILKKI